MYLQTWRLKVSYTKTVTAAFHLNNQEAKRSLKVYNNDRILPFYPIPTYHGVKLDRSLTLRHHLVAVRKNYSRVSHYCVRVRVLVPKHYTQLPYPWSTQQASTGAPVCCRSTHIRLIDCVLNDALRIVTGCLRPTPTDHLPILSGIQPAELFRLGATLFSLAYCGLYHR